MTIKRTARNCLLATISFLGTGFASTPVFAVEPAAVHLTFVGTRSCNDRTSLEREVERRTEIVRWEPESRDAVEIDVHISGEDSLFEALVVVEKPAAPGVARAITGSTCQEVIEGAALIIAVVLPAVLPPKSQPTRLQPAKDERRPTTPDAGLPMVNSKQTPLRFGAGTSGVLATGIAPAVLPGFEAFVDASTFANGWSPAFRFGLAYLARSRFAADADGGRAAFRLVSASAAACPAAWLPHRTVLLRPCITSAYGRLLARGSGTDTPRTESHPWITVGAGLRLETRLFEALSLEIAGATDVALFRGRFWFSDTVFHETARVDGRISVGLVAHIH